MQFSVVSRDEPHEAFLVSVMLGYRPWHGCVNRKFGDSCNGRKTKCLMRRVW